MLREQMLSTHPRKPLVQVSDLTSCISTISDCAVVCNSCADACLAEDQVQMLIKCIRLNQDCADACTATVRMLSRQTEVVPTVIRAQLEACIQICRACAEECNRHAGQHEHCRVCAESCRNCEQACLSMVEKFQVVQH